MNGVVKEQQRSVTPSSHLGKRKRSSSPEKPQINGNAHGVDADIDNLIREIKQSDIAPSILEYPLPNHPSTGPAVKKQKTDISDNTIEGRLALEWYATTNALLSDLRQVIANVRKDESKSENDEDTTVSSELDKIDSLLSTYAHPAVSGSESTHDAPAISAGQVMTVRSNIEGGAIKQLFTGLRLQPSNRAKPEEIDIRKLPNGFDVVDATAFDASQQSPQKDSRTFGQVFRQLRHARQLETPKTSRGTPGTRLKFAKPFENMPSANKDDYRIAALGAGSWLEYSASEIDFTKPITSKPALRTQDPDALFRAAFSSFAPSQDNTTAIVSRADRSRLWYRKHGSRAINNITTSNQPEETSTDIEYPEIEDDFQQLIDDYVPVTADDLKPEPSEPSDDAENILDEISELLQTLASYQTLRDLDKSRMLNSPIKPTGHEMDTFELLRQQLNLLVATLPPHAVAKLDGDKLKALNISTNILIHTPDVAGTGQPDEGTIHRQRVVQAQQVALNRTANTVPTRNSYTAAGTPAPNYNAQARGYSASAAQTPSLPGYAQRTAQMYGTPRPSVAATPSNYGQNPAYTRPQQPYPGATIQQYQRLQNGYGPNVQTPYQPRSGQTPYQSQIPMQNSIKYAGTASPAKPLTNGQSYGPQTPQTQNAQPRNQYSTPTTSTSLLQGSYAQANAHATIQQVKAAAQLQAQQSQSQSPQPQSIQSVQQNSATAVSVQEARQASGTPQPQQNSSTQTQQATKAGTGATTTSGTVNGVLSEDEDTVTVANHLNASKSKSAQPASVEANA